MRRKFSKALPLVVLLVLAAPAGAAEVMVLGTPHLAALEPAPTVDQRAVVIDRLNVWKPTLVCIEAMPSERVRQFAADPAANGELLATFALDALRLAPEQQVRLSVDAGQAFRMARELEQKPELDVSGRVRLIGLQLAAYEPWSALLNWSVLTDEQRADAEKSIGRMAAERLRSLSASSNEIVSLAIPVARHLRHRRLCTVDTFVDEVAVQSLEQELLPLLQLPSVQEGVNTFNALQAAQWKGSERERLSKLMRWMNSPKFAEADRKAEWNIFDGSPAGRRRLALWNARNAEIVAYLNRAAASTDGERTLLIIGAAHRPFIERALQAQSWTSVVAAESLFRGE